MSVILKGHAAAQSDRTLRGAPYADGPCALRIRGREQEFEFTTLDSKILPPSPIYTDNNLSRSKFTI
jgi:hypothetical protein